MCKVLVTTASALKKKCFPDLGSRNGKEELQKLATGTIIQVRQWLDAFNFPCFFLVCSQHSSG